MTESVGNVVSAEIAEDIHRLKAELETRDKQMEEVRRRAEEIEINFREVNFPFFYVLLSILIELKFQLNWFLGVKFYRQVIVLKT